MKRSACLLSALLIALELFAFPASASNTAVVYRKKNSSMKIALTFDDGPHPVYTEEILDILREYSIKATFFIVGENASYYPGIIKRTVNEGHELGNHTFYHSRPSKTPTAQLEKEIILCEDTLYEICEYKPKLFRPPEGVLPDKIKRFAQDEDYSIILWSIDTCDWAHTPIDDMISNIKNHISSGDIILMHDYVNNSYTPQMLRQIIPYLINEGYKFVTVSELIGSE